MKLKKRCIAFLIIAITFFLHITAFCDVQTDVPALKDVFANDFTIGCLLSYPHIAFPNDPVVPGQSDSVAPQGGNLIQYHMNSMSPGNNMKAMYTVDINASAAACAAATADKISFAETHPVVKFNGNLIAQLNWAKRNGFTFRGHTLVWHSQTAPEFFKAGYAASGERVTKEVMLARMENYIQEVIRQLHEGWPGMLSAMDVVNEAIDDSGNFRTNGNEWYTTFKDESYILKAFEFARKYTVQYGEKQMKLYYNDYNTSASIKANGIVDLCKPIYQKGFLDGIGMQEHDSNNSPTARDWIASYDKFYPVCNEMAITELDIATGSGTNNPAAEVLQTQANQYAMLFKCFIERSAGSGKGKIVNISKDGLNDQFTFKTNQSSSLWDINYQCKPAFYAIVDIAQNYKALAALIAQAEKLNKNDFSATDWEVVNTAIKRGKAAMQKNYSANESGVDGLKKAFRILNTIMPVKK